VFLEFDDNRGKRRRIFPSRPFFLGFFFFLKVSQFFLGGQGKVGLS